MSENNNTPDIAGHWVSESIEPMGAFFARREFRITAANWGVLFHAFADEEATKPLFTLDVGGVYVIGGESPVVANAHNAIFPATHRHVICESVAGAAMFAQMGGTIGVGERSILVEEGLGFMPALMDAMGEYDLVSLRDGDLYFGDRAGDLTKARPTLLTAFPVKKIGD